MCVLYLAVKKLLFFEIILFFSLFFYEPFRSILFFSCLLHKKRKRKNQKKLTLSYSQRRRLRPIQLQTHTVTNKANDEDVDDDEEEEEVYLERRARIRMRCLFRRLLLNLVRRFHSKL